MTYPTEVLADSPLVYWRLGEPSGTSAVDASGNSHPGTIVGSPTLGAGGLVAGDADTAFTFDGTISQRVHSTSTVRGAGTLTRFAIECLFDVPASGLFQLCELADPAGSAPDSISLSYSAGFVSFGFQGLGPISSPVATAAISTGVHHLVGEFTGTAVNLYIDGELADTQPFTNGGALLTVANSFGAGNDPYSGGGAAVGTLDEPAFYTDLLGPARVAAHATAAGFSPSFAPSVPTVTAIDPSNANIAGGATITVVGTDFTAATDVQVDATSASFTVIDDNTIHVTAPSHAAGAVHITVTNPGGTSAATSADLLTFDTLDDPPAGWPPWTKRVVTISGTIATAIPLSNVQSITRTHNQPREAIVTFPKSAYTRDQVHVFAKDDGTGDLHEIQLIRNGVVRFWGPAVEAEAGSGDGAVTLHCRDPLWYLLRRFLDAQRTNLLTNPSFETGTATGWTDVGALTSTVTTDDAVRGIYSLRLASSTDLGDIFEEQTISVEGTGVGTLVTIVAYFHIESITGHALDRRGLYVEGRLSGVFQTNDYYPIDEATPTDDWIRATCKIEVPPFTTWDLNIRFYSPPGSILWDDGQAVAMQSISTASLTGSLHERVDVAAIVELLMGFIQNPTFGKSDLNIGLDNPTIGIKQAKHIQWAQHISWFDQMSEWLNRDDTMDYALRNTDATHRDLVLYPGHQGTDRRGDFTIKFIARSDHAAYPGNVVSYKFTEDGGGTVTDDTELEQDTGDGPDREEGHYADASLIGGLILQSVNSAPTNAEPASLNPIARDVVNRNRRPAQLFVFTLKGEQIAPGSGQPWDELLGLGDICDFQVVDGWTTVDGFGRIAKLVEYPRTRLLEVTIATAL